MARPIRPTKDRVFVERLARSEGVTGTGLYLPVVDTKTGLVRIENQANTGVVRAVGPKVQDPRIAPGVEIIVTKFRGEDHEHDGAIFTVLKEEDVVGFVHRDQDTETAPIKPAEPLRTVNRGIVGDVQE